MPDFRQVSLEELQSLMRSHAIDASNGIDGIEINHTRRAGHHDWGGIMNALRDHHSVSTRSKTIIEHLIVDPECSYWIEGERMFQAIGQWFGRRRTIEKSHAARVVVIDMIVDPDDVTSRLKTQLHSIAEAIEAISTAFGLDELPAVSWHCIDSRGWPIAQGSEFEHRKQA